MNEGIKNMIEGVDNNVDSCTEEYTSISLCSGYGGIEIGLRQAIRTRTLCYVEIGVEVCEILVNLMGQELIDEAPIWSDLTNFPTDIFRDRVDIVQGGFPCQPFSHAGLRRGASDERNLWPSVSRVIREVRPSVVFLENVPGIIAYHFDTIRPELSEMGYVVTEGLFSAGVDGGAPQKRQRLFILAYSPGTRMQRRGMPQHLTDYIDELADSESERHGRGDSPQCGDEQRFIQSEKSGRSQVGSETQGRNSELAYARDTGLQGTTRYDCHEKGTVCAGVQSDGDRVRGRTGRGSNELAHSEHDGLTASEVREGQSGTIHDRDKEGQDNTRQPTGVHPPRNAPEELAHTTRGRFFQCESIGQEARDISENSEPLAHASSGRGEGGEIYGRDEPEASGRGETGASRSSGEANVAHGKKKLPLFPPGPNDARGWEWVLSRWPQLSPTYCKEGHGLHPEVPTSPSRVRGVADGPMSGVDKRLRAVGNGVVPITCAIAFHTLGRGRIF